VLITGAGSVAVVIASADTMVPPYVCVALTAFASVAVTVKLYAPGVVGVPLMTPLAAFSAKPAGSVPLLMLNATGAVPPDVCTDWLYGASIRGTGSVTVAIASAGTIVPLYVCVAVTAFASVAVTANVYGPEAPGVPLITPLDAFKVKPDGSDPDVMANVIGAVPPVVWIVCVYAVLTSGGGNVPVTIARLDAIVPLNERDAVTAFASVAATVKLYGAAIVGVPLIVPVDGSRLKPAGSDPDETVNVIGSVPPDV
jgi:hypothetical protein